MNKILPIILVVVLSGCASLEERYADKPFVPDQIIHKAKAVNVSDNQLYKQLGNAVAVNVIRHIANNLLKAL